MATGARLDSTDIWCKHKFRRPARASLLILILILTSLVGLNACSPGQPQTPTLDAVTLTFCTPFYPNSPNDDDNKEPATSLIVRVKQLSSYTPLDDAGPVVGDIEAGRDETWEEGTRHVVPLTVADGARTVTKEQVDMQSPGTTVFLSPSFSTFDKFRKDTWIFSLSVKLAWSDGASETFITSDLTIIDGKFSDGEATKRLEKGRGLSAGNPVC